MSVYMIFLLLGGLGMFLYGMKMMSDRLEKVAGDRMRRVLELLMTHRFTQRRDRSNSADTKFICHHCHGHRLCKRRAYVAASGNRCHNGCEYRNYSNRSAYRV